MNLTRKIFAISAFLLSAFAVTFTLLSKLHSIISYLLIIVLYIATLLLLYFLLKIRLNPLEEIAAHIKAVAEGKTELLPELSQKDYINLIHELNSITERLQLYETKLAKQKEGFNIIIDSLQEAIWIQDKKGRIRAANRRFQELVQQKSSKDQYFWNVIQIPELYELADRIYKNPMNLSEDVIFGEKHFICSASFSSFTAETIFILYDITELRRLETLKRDFIINISHELRTPLTSIKGYLEMFDEKLTTEQKSYLDIIRRNTNRLTHIVNDLLTLSKMEHDKSLEIENIVINDFIMFLKSIFLNKMNEKNLQFSYENRSSLEFFRADRYKVEQLFINLIDNAVKYTDKGKITLLVTEDESQLHFELSDSGCGIAEQHLKRIFERFYVVDKSRSRKLGGTGLGLSIVKHIVNLHDGMIDIKSTPGVGTTFVVKLPKR
jgi:two-component system phosphate regulon sensor histidine kinase PhoR